MTQTAEQPGTTNNREAAAAHEVLRGRDLLCFSHDWTGDPLSKTHLMRLLSKDNRILWTNSIGQRMPTASKRDVNRAFRKLAAAASPLKEVEPNIFVLNPLVIPAYGRPAIRALNRQILRLQVRRAMKKLGFRRPINWVFNPAAAIVAGSLGEEMIIYYCVDEYSAQAGVPAESLLEMERSLIEKSDLVVVSAEKLLHSKSKHNPNTHLVRHGVNHDHFRKSLDASTEVPAELAKLKRPVIGYFGLMSEDWIDLDLLVKVAESFPDASLVMLGKVTMDLSRLEKLPNVHLLGRKPYESLPAYSKAFDVAIIPFPISELTLNSNPLKAREYLASGLPVVSTDIPEVAVLGQCRVAKTHDDFVNEIREALKDPGPKAERSEAVRGESWQARLDTVRGYIADLGPNGRRAAGKE